MSNVINLPNASEDIPDITDADLAKKCHTKDGKLNKLGRKVAKNMIQHGINDAQRRLDNDELSGVIFLHFDKLDEYEPMIAGSVSVFGLRKCLLEMIDHIKEGMKDDAAH